MELIFSLGKLYLSLNICDRAWGRRRFVWFGFCAAWGVHDIAFEYSKDA